MYRVVVFMLLLVMSSCWKKTEYYILTDSCPDDTLSLSTEFIDLYWEWENRKYHYKKERDRIYVALKRIPPKYLSEWLHENNKHIEFEESINGILCHHYIGNRNDFTLGTVKETLTFQEINEKLALRSYHHKKIFQHYGALSFDANGKLALIPSSVFRADKHYFSIAFFLAVGRDNDMNDKTNFTFQKAMYKGKEVIVIEVNGIYYDFAQFPPLR